MVSINFYKNPERIGGGITEIKYNDHRLVIDMGAELEFNGDEPNPNIEGVTIGNDNCGGVLITHYHGDHIALVKYVLQEVPVYMSKVSQEISLAIYKKLESAKLVRDVEETVAVLKRARTFAYDDFGKDFKVGVFRVRPIRVDHSAFDALAYLITVGGKKIFFTGDFRSHGHTGKALFNTLKYYVGKVDVIITEGTNLNRSAKQLSEFELKEQFKEVCAKNKYVLYLGASTNIDSLVSMAYAAKETQKPFSVDEFQQKILNIIDDNSKSAFYKKIKNKYSWEKGRVIAVRMSGRSKVEGFFRKYKEDTVIIYSMWNGYIERNPELKKWKEMWGNRFIHLHSSGHASVDDIKCLVEICSKGKNETLVIPMHLENFQDIDDLNLQAKICKVAQNKAFVITE